MKTKANVVQIWRINLLELSNQFTNLLSLLSSDEMVRANRFKFEVHRQRFVVARGMLRKILSLYTDIDPAKIVFSYGSRGKPFLQDYSQQIQFNVSHSENLGVIAVTTQQDIGVDIEKMENEFKEDVAKRFFSQAENDLLQTLSEANRIEGFYRIWSKKEALIKALGEGLYAPLETFSVSAQDGIEKIGVKHEGKIFNYHVQNFFVHEEYQAALATSEVVNEIQYWSWQNNSEPRAC